MEMIVPDYYDDFSCIAGKCAHSCCIGWEIDIDPDTYEYYRTIGAELGERLRRSISVCGGAAQFILTDSGRCPFLNGQGLCDLILELGEDSLCGICADHPRFRNYIGEYTELGIGLSCEAAASLILSRKEPARLIYPESIMDADNGIRGFLAEREKMFAVVQNRELPLEKRIKELLAACGIREPDAAPDKWHKIYSGLEILDPAWPERLCALKHIREPHIDSALEVPFEQLIVYFLFRHMTDGLYDERLKARILFAVHAVRVIAALCRGLRERSGMTAIEAAADTARMYSAEIEYSDTNLDNILNILDSYT